MIPAFFHSPSQEATVSRPWRNAGVLRSLGEGGLELRRVTPYRTGATGSCPWGSTNIFYDLMYNLFCKISLSSFKGGH